MGIPLEQKHVEEARLYATRNDMVSVIVTKKHGVVAEIGVAQGDFSEFLIHKLSPAKFVAFDVFELHTHPTVWGIPSNVMFNGMTHEAFYRQRFCRSECEVVMEKGLSWENLPRYSDRTFDLIYVDAGHDYESVKRDANLCALKLADDGIIIFNLTTS
jgi:23S rRNA U2552 (ribose-2'-O)-methylase RlmE/FtsJ